MEPMTAILVSALAGKILDELLAKSDKFKKYEGLFSWIARAARVFIKK